MRREDLIAAVERISTDLRETGLAALTNGRSREGGRSDQGGFLQTLYLWSAASSTYGEIEKKILGIFSLQILLEPDSWPQIQEAYTEGHLDEFVARIRNASEFGRQIVKLLTPDYQEAVNSESENLPSELRGKSILKALVVEDDGRFSNPDRIVFAIRSISDLYVVHAALDFQEPDDLVLLSCDSGSDKSFDFAGAGKTIAAVKDTIIGLWDRVVFHRHAQAGATVELIAQTLPVLERISELEKSNKLPPELAEQLRRKTLGACAKFVEAGVIIPEMDREASHSPRSLMSPSTKLLASPTHAQEIEAEPSSTKTPEGEGSQAETDGDEVDLVAEIRELKRRLNEAEKPTRRRSTAGRTSRKK